jgi:hypothetical protein
MLPVHFRHVTVAYRQCAAKSYEWRYSRHICIEIMCEGMLLPVQNLPKVSRDLLDDRPDESTGLKDWG